MTAPGDATKGNPSYEVMGVNTLLAIYQEKMDELIAKVLIVQTKPGNVPPQETILDEGEGVPVQTFGIISVA